MTKSLSWKTGIVALGFVGALSGLSGCDAPEDGPDEEFRETYACPVWRCGYNSAEINGRSIRELNLDGQPNGDGVRLVGFIPPVAGLLGGYKKLDVVGDALVARNAHGAELRGAALVGATLLLEQSSGLVTPITVLAYEEVHSWSAGAAPIAAYTFVHVDLHGVLGQRNVCNGSLTSLLAAPATVLGGETYDLESKEVEPGRSRWFTIACAGSAAAKLALLGYGPQRSATTPARRQATLKMITADYCGDGVSYTQNGTPLHWENASGSVALAASAGAGLVEAVWSADGARCLDATRLPDGEPDCDLPRCDAFTLADGEWRTHVPQ